MTDLVKPSNARRTEHLNDVFVLGAGVSVPYGFPTGDKLLGKMRQEDLGYSIDNYELLRIGLDPSLVHPKNWAQRADGEMHWRQSVAGQKSVQWQKLLRGSVILSIDQFLKNLADDTLRTFGKQLMARQILRAERNSCVDPASLKLVDEKDPRKQFSMHRIDWIQQFLTRVDLLGNWDEYLKATTFLTFNYDRVLEFYLLRYLRNDKNLTVKDAEDFLGTLKIHHLNGYLGSLKELPFGNLRGADEEFDPLFETGDGREHAVDWTAVGLRMRTVWEDPDLHPEITNLQDQAREAVAKAGRIFVMGTSFIPENLEAIGLTKGARLKALLGTDSGLAAAQSEAALALHGSWPVNATASGLSDAQKERAAQLLGLQDTARLVDKIAEDFVVDHVVL